MDLSTDRKVIVWAWTEDLAALDSWSVAAGHLYFITASSGRHSPQLIDCDLKTKRTRPLKSVRTVVSGWQTGLTISPDHKSALIANLDRDDTDLMLLKTQK